MHTLEERDKADSDRESLRALVVRLREVLQATYDEIGSWRNPSNLNSVKQALSLVPSDLAECCVIAKSDIEPGGKYILRGIYDVAAKQRTDLLEAMREIVGAKTLGDAVVLAIQALNPDVGITDKHITALREAGRGGE